MMLATAVSTTQHQMKMRKLNPTDLELTLSEKQELKSSLVESITTSTNSLSCHSTSNHTLNLSSGSDQNQEVTSTHMLEVRDSLEA